MDDDWIVNILDKSKIFTDELMQELFARILAGEANSPGTFSKKSVNLLAELEKRDAIFFKSLCRFNWNICNHPYPLVFEDEHEIYNKNGVDFPKLRHLENLGLIQHSITRFRLVNLLTEKITINYHDSILVLEAPDNGACDLFIGYVMLTMVGLEICQLFENEPVEGFFEYVKKQWSEYT